MKGPAEYDAPSEADFKTQELAHEPEALNIEKLPTLARDQLTTGIVR
ncbi:MAG: hypothetical protein ACI8ZT_002337 [Bacteroidia bacterium]